MSKWFRNIIGIIILGILLWYLSGHWGELKELLKLSPKALVAIYFVSFLGVMNNTYVIQHLLGALKVKTFFWDMAALQNTAALLNYIPMKFGTVFRANYLKRHYGLKYAYFATFFIYLSLLMAITAAIVGIVVLAAVYGLDGYERKVLFLVFLGLLAVSVFFAFIPLPVPKGSGKLTAVVRNFLTSRRQVAGNKSALLVCTALLGVNFVLTSLRIAIIYHSMGYSIHPAGYLILGALGFVTMFVGLTPGALGIRELVLGSGAAVLGVPIRIGILAAMIDRAITLSWVFVVGGACAIWLWRKSPGDFKQAKSQMAQERTATS